MKKLFFQNFLLLTALAFSVVSCQKEISGSGNPRETPVDLGTKVRSHVSGFVTDENDAPVQGASVKVGVQTVTTDAYGFFEAANVEVSKNAATVHVNMPGYFPGIRTYIAANNKAAFVRIKLLPKTNAGTIDAAAGGTVTLSNGLKINLPANAVVNATGGAAYTGPVNVAAKWLDPTAADLDRIMPGDLRAIDGNNTMKLLVTYGMAAVELTGAAGEKLQIAAGKKAKLTLPLPASLAGAAPSTIPLWHFDEAIGLWKEEGSATKVGNTYEGEVSHFSFWNCDFPIEYVQLDMTVKDGAGVPVRYALVKVTLTSNTNNWTTGLTDSAGFVQGAVPANSQFKVEVFYGGCGTPLHTQTITTGSNNLSLGTVTIASSVNTANISGTVTNCSNTAVTDGRIILKTGSTFYSYRIASDGTYNISTVLCNVSSMPVSVIAEDIGAGQQSSQQDYTITPGSNNVGNIQACGTTTEEYINLIINGVTYSFTAPADSVAYNNNNQTAATVSGIRNTGGSVNPFVNMIFLNAGLGIGSTQPLGELLTNHIPEIFTVSTGSAVTITEYGAIGQFVSGTIAATGTGVAAPNTVYNITGNFRVRRYN